MASIASLKEGGIASSSSLKLAPGNLSSINLSITKNFKVMISVNDNLYNVKGLVSLVWVKAHASNPGNELPDHFAKISSSGGADMSIPAPYSYVKRVCKEFLMNE
ncbi:hypothetical protein AVEN_198846-1 [Araneus ventricosus]|uniref:Uncharacterized protein n=1 Tax=Araneus ventricosus TaxID=182803 RepID=A0A4Y2JDP5_ARAVE|nr:hypothetical protein AVEN_198846-1 [Araneus ventricosus]